jgi:hypothetical protein
MTPQTILGIAMRIAGTNDRPERDLLAADIGIIMLRLIGLRIRSRAYDATTIEDPSTGAHYTLPRSADQTLTIGEILAMLDATPAAGEAS